MSKCLLLDCDGLIADFITPTLKIIHEHAGVLWKESDLQSWDFFADLSDDKRMLCEKALQLPGFCSNLKPYEQALLHVPKLFRDYDSYIVTSPLSSPTWVHERENWLNNHFGIKKNRIIHTPAKHKIIGDVFVDDNADNIRNWQKHHPSKIALLWHVNYNKNEDLPRVYSWEQLTDYLK